MSSINKHYSFLLFLIVALLAGCVVNKATRFYQKELHIIKMAAMGDPATNYNDVKRAIPFFEKTTGIGSESDGDFFGRYKPTLNDYNRWEAWFKTNHDRLYWDETTQQVKVKSQ